MDKNKIERLNQIKEMLIDHLSKDGVNVQRHNRMGCEVKFILTGEENKISYIEFTFDDQQPEDSNGIPKKKGWLSIAPSTVYIDFRGGSSRSLVLTGEDRLDIWRPVYNLLVDMVRRNHEEAKYKVYDDAILQLSGFEEL